MIIPLKVDVPRWRHPLVNYAIFAVCVLMFFIAEPGSELFWDLAGVEIRHGGLMGDAPVAVDFPTQPYAVLALTSSFLHAGWLHLIGNMLFLWIFGNAVNYKFGHPGFAGFYIGAAFVSGMAHYAFQGGPAVGASGAINGLVGAFLVFFPRNNITVFFCILLPFICPKILTVSSGWIILYWVAWDVFYLWIGAQTGIAVWAHVAGFLTGFGVALLCAAARLIKPTEDEQTLLEVLRARR